MQIFLGKNWLGQSDKQDVKLSPVEINSSYDLSNLTEEELLQLRGILGKAKSNGNSADTRGN